MGFILYGLFVSLFACVALNAEMLNFSENPPKVHYTIKSNMDGRLKMSGKKGSLKGRTTLHYLVNQRQNGKIEIAIKKIFMNLAGKKGKKPMFKWLYDSAKRKTSRGFPFEIKYTCKSLLKKPFVFEIRPTGKIIETTGRLRIIENTMDESDMLGGANFNLISGFRSFIAQLFHLSHQDLQSKKYKLPAEEFFPDIKKLKLKNKKQPLPPIIYNVKKNSRKGRYKGRYAYIKGNISGKRKGVLSQITTRGKVHWDPTSALVQQRTYTTTILTKKKGDSIRIKSKDSWTAKALEPHSP